MNAKELENRKLLLSPPGDTIQETIDHLGMSQAELAERLGRPKEKINSLIKGNEPLTAETAFRLEKVLGIDAGFWLNREREYRQELFAINQVEFLHQCEDWLKEFPTNEMKKMGILSKTNEKAVMVDETLKFFSVASPQEWEKIYVKEEVSVAFRISLANTSSPQALSIWLRKGELDAFNLNVTQYDETKFKQTLKEIKNLVHQMPPDYATQLQAACAACGVAVVYVQNLPKAPVSGASRWYHGKPIIQLSGRYKTDDHFWFTFYHEAAHILLHGKKEIFLENIKGTTIDQEKENEANDFASESLLTTKEYQEILDRNSYKSADIEHFAKKFNTSSGVIIGRLQRDKELDYSKGNELRKKVDLVDFFNHEFDFNNLNLKDQIEAQIDSIANLQPGWFEGKGVGFDLKKLKTLQTILLSRYTISTKPFIYPMPNGGISVEWENEQYDISLEIDLHDFAAHYHAYNKIDEAETERQLNIYNQTDWDFLNNALQTNLK